MTVEGESGGAYTGAWVARDDGCTYLFGSFHIDTDALPSNVRSALKKKMCDAAGGTDPHERLVKLLDLVEEGVKAGAVVKAA